MSTTPQTFPISSPPGQEDQGARLAASAKVGQVEGTLSPEAEATCDWLENDWDSFASALFPVEQGV